MTATLPAPAPSTPDTVRMCDACRYVLADVETIRYSGEIITRCREYAACIARADARGIWEGAPR